MKITNMEKFRLMIENGFNECTGYTEKAGYLDHMELLMKATGIKDYEAEDFVMKLWQELHKEYFK